MIIHHLFCFIAICKCFCTEIAVEKHFDPQNVTSGGPRSVASKFFSRLAIARVILGPPRILCCNSTTGSNSWAESWSRINNRVGNRLRVCEGWWNLEDILSICCNSEKVLSITVFARVLCETVSDNIRTSSCHDKSSVVLSVLNTMQYNFPKRMVKRVPTPPGKSWIFSWKFQDLESPGKSLWSWKVLEIEA